MNYSDALIIILFLAIVVIIGIVVTYFGIPFLQQVRGPAIDITVNTELNIDGNLSEYSLVAIMSDEFSYNKYLSNVNSKGYSTIKEYFLRDISDKTLFDFQYDEKNKKIKFKSNRLFNPNQELKTISIDKSKWIFRDFSFVKGTEYFFPDEYINSIKYTFTTTAAIYNTSGEISEHFLFGNKSKWIINRNKEAFDSTSNSIIIPTFYVETSHPQAPIGVLVPIFALGLVIVLRKRNKW